MGKKQRLISFFLVFLFGFLFLKNLLPDVADHNHDNHNEIGHIHFYHVKSKVSSKLTEIIDTKSAHQQSGDDEDCSSGKSIFTYSPVPSGTYKIEVPGLITAFDLVFNLTNNFKTPYLEPHRKPPRQTIFSHS